MDAPRSVAYDVLRRVLDDGAYANLTLPQALRERRIHGRDAAFATEITYGTLRNLGVIDAIIDDCSTRPLDRIDPQVLHALRLGVYQLLYTRVGDHAAVDTTVRLVSGTEAAKLKGFANAVLRQAAKQDLSRWIERLTPRGEVAGIAFRHAHPEWIARSFAQAVGIGELEAALEADSLRPKVHLVARPGDMTAEELAAITGGTQGTLSPYSVILDQGDPGEIEAVTQGFAAVQDEGSQLIAVATAKAPLVGEDQGRWLDLCAGPGGKAALLGSLAQIDGAEVTAVEVAAHRAELIRKTTRNLPVSTVCADGRTFDPGHRFDRVLVDAPCSGLGALRRRPEARWRKTEADLIELTTLQRELLRQAVELVRPGGIVVYSTCSPDLRETRGAVDAILAETPVQELQATDVMPGLKNVGSARSAQLWPHRHGTDAMFFAMLQKSQDPSGTVDS